MADLSELLSLNDPEAYKKLLALRDSLRVETPFNEAQAGREATEQAYKQVFGKQLAQDVVSSQSIPPKTAAQSAEVFQKALPEAIEEGKNLVPYKQAATMEGMASKAGTLTRKALPVLGKAAGAAGLVSSLYGDLADPNDFRGEEVPGRPGYYFKGPDIVKIDSAFPVPAEGGEAPRMPSSEPEEEKKEEIPTTKEALVEKLNKFTGKTPVESKLNTSDVISRLLGSQDKELRAAQESANMGRLIAMLGQAGATTGAALTPLANVKPDTQFFDKLGKMADQPVQDIKERRGSQTETIKNEALKQSLSNEMTKNDPTSTISRVGQSILSSAAKQAGIELPDVSNLSLSAQEKILPGIENMANKKLMSESIKAKKEENQILRERALSSRIENQTNTRYDRSTKDIVNSLEASKRIDGFLDEIKSGALIPSSNVAAQLTNDISMLLAGRSQTALADREKASINTLQTTMSKIQSYAMSKPTSAIPQEYLNQIKVESDILKKKYFNTFDRNVKSQLAGSNDPLAKEIIQNRYDEFMNNYQGVDAKQGAIEAFMKSNGIEDKNEAIKILREAGKL